MEGKLPFTVTLVSLPRVDIGFRCDLTNGKPENHFWLPLRDESRQYLEPLTTFARGLVERLSKIQGIKRVDVERNDIHITLSGVHRWRADIGPLVKSAVGFAAVDISMTAFERRKRTPKARPVAMT